MQHYQNFAPSRTEQRESADLRAGATARMLAAMAEPDRVRPGRTSFSAYAWEARETDLAYFRRRSEEERTAVSKAAGVEARGAHRELSELYAQLVRALSTPWQDRRATRMPSVRIAAATRAERQDALLDSGLMETFPASDPVSVVLIN